MKLSDTLQRNLKIPNTVIDGDIVVMSLENDEYYTMSDAAARIWALTEQPIAVNTLFQQLEAEYHVQNPIYQQETQAFLRAGLDKDLFSIVDPKTKQSMDDQTINLHELLEKSVWQAAPKLSIFAMSEFTKLGTSGSADGGGSFSS